MVRSILSMMLSTWFALSPAVAHAQRQDHSVGTVYLPNGQVLDLSKSEPQKPKLPPTMRVFPNYREVVARDQKGDEFIIQIPITPEHEMRKFSPKALAKELAVKNFNSVKATTKRFPMESALFFMSIGAVTAYQIASDYSSNPMRMAQHVEHSLSPLGSFSFYMFMTTSGMVGTTMETFIKNPAFHHMIPYMSMSAGYFVQSTIASFAADPNVQACVKQNMGLDISQMEGIEKDPCEAAFSYYAVKGKFYEMTPGLISMLTSQFVTWGAERLLVKAVLRFTGIDIALWLTPFGPSVSGFRIALTNAIKMGLFYYIDVVFFNHVITSGFKNIYDGNYLRRIDDELVRRIVWKKQNAWKDQLTPTLCEMSKDGKDCARDLADTLKEYQKQLAAWRTMNLAKVHEAHMAWEDMLNKATTGFDLSYSFYRDLVDEVRNSKWKITDPQRLDVADPLFGIAAMDLPAEMAITYYARRDYTDPQASLTAREVGRWIQSRLKAGNYTSDKGIHPPAVKILQEISEKLVHTDMNVQGAGVAVLNRAYSQNVYGKTPAFSAELREIAKRLGGRAQPLMLPGQGFFARYELWSPDAENMKKSRLNKGAGIYLTEKPTEYLGLQSICGADLDKDGKVVSLGFGGGAQFLPPRMSGTSPQICQGFGQIDAANSYTMYTTPLQAGDKKYNGFVEYLKGEIKPEIVGSQNESGFLPWWESKVEPQMKDFYTSMAKSYDDIVVLMAGHLHSTERAKLNKGPAANGVVESIRQQMRLDLMILGEVLKDTYALQHKQELPIQYFSRTAEPVPMKMTMDPNTVHRNPPSLLEVLQDGGSMQGVRNPSIFQTSVLEFNKLAPLLKTDSVSNGSISQAYHRNMNAGTWAKTGRVKGHPLQIQEEVEYEFENLIRMLRQIKVVEVDGRKQISSSLENADLNKQLNKVTAKLRAFAQLMDLDNKKEDEVVTDDLEAPPSEGGEELEAPVSEKASVPVLQPIVKLPTEEVRNVAMAALEDITALTHEIVMYGSIANAVSWEKIRALEQSEAQKAVQNGTQKTVKEMQRNSGRMGGPR